VFSLICCATMEPFSVGHCQLEKKGLFDFEGDSGWGSEIHMYVSEWYKTPCDSALWQHSHFF